MTTKFLVDIPCRLSREVVAGHGKLQFFWAKFIGTENASMLSLQFEEKSGLMRY